MKNRELTAVPLTNKYLIWLHLLPIGIAFINMLVYRPLAASSGVPPLFAGIILWVITIAVELGLLLYVFTGLK